MFGLKSLIGLVALAATAIAWGSAAEATTLNFNLQGDNVAYSWTMDDHPTVATHNASEFTTTDFIGQAIGGSAALPAGNTLYFYNQALFLGGMGIQDSLGNSLYDSFGDQAYSGDEGTPLFSIGTYNFEDFSGGHATLTISAIAATPVPAALPLFASAIAGLGFVGWRRKRATSAV
ncbi:MAG TPA: hypothetical protein VHE77_18705 [Dongiaceae bacterium]|nr:hypothetical protein [Dongiaceae bacterium]